jgi:murein DD-endopeptidase MepM/ murein hydrolase activator NlpD
MSGLSSTKLFCTLTAGLVLSACQSDSSGIEPLPGVEITVTPANVVLPIGGRAALTATVTDLQGRPLRGYQIKWSSSAPAIAEVTSSGVVTARNVGSAAIGAYAGQGVGFARAVVRLDFRLPVSDEWMVVSEMGTPSADCPGGEGGLRVGGGRECGHAGVSRYSLDLADPAQWGGQDAPPPRVFAAAAGTISDICLQPPTEITCGPNGPFVLVDHAGGFQTIYAHLEPSSVFLRRKTPVSQGEPLGSMGRWGTDRAPWLHFEIRYQNQGAREAAVLEAVRVGGRTMGEYRVEQVP